MRIAFLILFIGVCNAGVIINPEDLPEIMERTRQAIAEEFSRFKSGRIVDETPIEIENSGSVDKVNYYEDGKLVAQKISRDNPITGKGETGTY